MTERFTPAPGDSVWVKLIGCGSCPWWPGKVVNPQTCPQRYQGKKKLVAAVFFLSDNTFSLVTDEKNILPFDCKEKESFLETGKELRYRSQKLRLAFDYDVCCISGKTDNPAPQRNLSLNATPESSTMHLRRNRHRTEPMMRKVSSPSCSSYPWKNNRQKTTEPCSSVSTDAQPLQAPMNGETLIAEETPLKCCAIPQLDSVVDPLTNNLHITDGVSLKTSIHTLPLSSVFQESSRQQGSGDSLLRQTSHAPQSFSTPMPVCIVYPEDSRGGNSNSCPSGTPAHVSAQCVQGWAEVDWFCCRNPARNVLPTSMGLAIFSNYG
ncbi:hypothetical protein LSAT2_032960 [Lamellibrachia satsuma]|nr:hypothetical protein LSAT2_032960 [Lamellibrachia satsuma]